MIEDKGEQTIQLLNRIVDKLERKVEIKERTKKNSHIHLMINTEEKNKIMEKARSEGLSFSEWCRRKLRENSQLDRIESKLDKFILERAFVYRPNK